MSKSEQNLSCYAFADSPVGELLLVARSSRLVGVYFVPCAYPPDPEDIGERVEVDSLPVLETTARQLGEYFSHQRRRFELPLVPPQSLLAAAVRELMLAIPFGETRTYGQLAASAGKPGMAQAIGQAVGRNPMSIVVPCHRVVGSDGSLTGFAGGLDRKRFLLSLEEPPAHDAGRLF